MKSRILIILLFSLTIYSCKTDKKNESQQEEGTEQIALNDFVTVRLDVVALKDDSFHVYYSEDKSETFTEENSIWVEFKGSPNAQTLVFNLPKGRVPTNIRIDFGVKENQESVKINNFEISYLDKRATVAGVDFFKYFRPDESRTIVEIASQSVKPLKTDKKEYLGPSMYSLEPISKEIDKLFL